MERAIAWIINDGYEDSIRHIGLCKKMIDEKKVKKEGRRVWHINDGD